MSTTHPKRHWTLTPAAKVGRIDVQAGIAEGVAPIVEVAAPPFELLLALWKRLTTAEAGLQITGDLPLVAALFDLDG